MRYDYLHSKSVQRKRPQEKQRDDDRHSYLARGWYDMANGRSTREERVQWLRDGMTPFVSAVSLPAHEHDIRVRIKGLERFLRSEGSIPPRKAA